MYRKIKELITDYKNKQNYIYKFSAPMPYTIEHIDKLLDINNQVEKSRITSLFFSLPSTCELFTGFEQYRNNVLDKDWEYWKSLIAHSLDKGQDFIYLLNNPTRLPIEAPDFEQRLDKLDKLLNELRKLGVNKLRIAEHKLMSYIEKHYPDFIIYASTSFEMKSIQEYRNFMFMHPSVKQIVPSHDSIKNFTLLKNLKKMLPNVEIELMVNEGCIYGCPNRYGHASEIMDRNTIHRNDICMSNKYYTLKYCSKISNQIALVRANNIYPWEIAEYRKIGISNFKLVGRDSFNYKIENYLREYLMYFKGIENIKNIENEPINTFIHHLSNNKVLNELTVKEIKYLLPNIHFFKKKGELCAIRCGINCNYCLKSSERIETLLKEKPQNAKTSPICIMSKVKV